MLQYLTEKIEQKKKTENPFMKNLLDNNDAEPIQ